LQKASLPAKTTVFVNYASMASSQPRPSFWNRQLKDARPFDLLKAETWRHGKARWTANYYVKHIRPGSLKPVLHFFVFGIFAWQYALQWKTLHGTLDLETIGLC